MSFETGITLDAQSRTKNGKTIARQLRRDGFVPVTIYGGQDEAASGAIAKREFTAILRAHGRNTIFTLNFENTATPVKIADLQLDPVKGSLLHADLMRISLTEKTEFEIPIEVVGEPHGVRLSGGILDQPIRSLKIRCLPTDLPSSLKVEVTALGLGDHFRVSDLQIDRDKIEVLTDGEAVIATVVAPRIAEESTVAAAEPAQPEVIKKGKAEESAEK